MPRKRAKPRVRVVSRDVGGFDYDYRIAEGVEVEVVDFPGWRFTLDVALAGPIVRLVIEPTTEGVTPSGGITKRNILRPLPIDAMATAVRRHASAWLARAGSATNLQMSPGLAAEFAGWAREFDTRPRPGKAGRADQFYAEFARDYLAAVESGERVKDFAARCHRSRSQVSNLLGEAQRRELFESAGQGRRGGHLTDLGKNLLGE